MRALLIRDAFNDTLTRKPAQRKITLCGLYKGYYFRDYFLPK